MGDEVSINKLKHCHDEVPNKAKLSKQPQSLSKQQNSFSPNWSIFRHSVLDRRRFCGNAQRERGWVEQGTHDHCIYVALCREGTIIFPFSWKRNETKRSHSIWLWANTSLWQLTLLPRLPPLGLCCFSLKAGGSWTQFTWTWIFIIF